MRYTHLTNIQLQAKIEDQRSLINSLEAKHLTLKGYQILINNKNRINSEIKKLREMKDALRQRGGL